MWYFFLKKISLHLCPYINIPDCDRHLWLFFPLEQKRSLKIYCIFCKKQTDSSEALHSSGSQIDLSYMLSDVYLYIYSTIVELVVHISLVYLLRSHYIKDSLYISSCAK